MTQPHLLIIDDDVVFTGILTRTMQRHYPAISSGHCCHDAEQLIRQNTFTHALIDLHIGSESGLELISTLLSAQPDLRIVVLTGYSSIASCVDAIKRGAHNYLCKPINSADILSAFSEKSDIAITNTPPSVERLEWEHIQKILQEHQGNKSATARALGMHRRTLQRKLQKRPTKS